VRKRGKTLTFSRTPRGPIHIPHAGFYWLTFNDLAKVSFSSEWCPACYEWHDSLKEGLSVRGPDGAMGLAVQGEDDPVL